MAKKIDYEMLLIKGAFGDVKRQQKIVKQFKGKAFKNKHAQALFDLMEKATREYDCITYENLYDYASGMTDNINKNNEYVSNVDKVVESITAEATMVTEYVESTDFDNYFKIVKDQMEKDKLMSIIKLAHLEVENGNFEEAIKKLDMTSIKNELGKKKYKSENEKLATMLAELDNDYSPETKTGFKTGISMIDKCIGKVKQNEMMIIAGESAAGKSLLCTNIFADLVLKQKKNVIYIGLEMSFNDNMARLASIIAGINTRFFRGSFESTEAIQSEMQKTLTFANKMSILNNWALLGIDEFKNGNIDDVLATCKGVAQVKGWEKIDCIILDYLQFLPKCDYKMTEFEAAKDNIHKIKSFIVGENIPMIVISSLNAENKIKGATDVLYTADFAIMVTNDTRNRDIKNVEITKNRYGNYDSMKIKYDDCLRVQELEKK